MTHHQAGVLLAVIVLGAPIALPADKPAAPKPTATTRAASGPATSPAASPARAGDSSLVPDDEAIARASKMVRSLYADEYNHTITLAQRAALGARFLKEALETKDDLAARFVLLCEARDWSAKGGEPATACRAIEELTRQFAIPPAEMTLNALQMAQRFTVAAAAKEALVRSALAGVDQALLRDDYDLAARLAGLAESVASGTRRIMLITEVQDKSKEITWAKTEYDKSKNALEKLSTRPDDKDAKSAAGRFKCLVKNDWDHGLPLMLDGSDAEDRARAERDLAAGSGDANAQNEIGNDWWELGEKLTGRAKQSCRARAAFWYHKALPRLKGISRTTVEKRLDEVELARLREMHLIPGLIGEYFGDKTWQKLLAIRTDANLDFEWPGAPGEGLPKDDFSVRWNGLLRVPVAGKYTFTIHVNEGGKLFIDDKPVIDEPDGTRKKKGTSATIALTDGLHAIRVEFFDGGGLARVRVLWSGPTIAEEPIPAKAFVHEQGLEK